MIEHLPSIGCEDIKIFWFFKIRSCRRHLGFLKSLNFIGYWGGESRDAVGRYQVWSKKSWCDSYIIRYPSNTVQLLLFRLGEEQLSFVTQLAKVHGCKSRTITKERVKPELQGDDRQTWCRAGLSYWGWWATYRTSSSKNPTSE